MNNDIAVVTVNWNGWRMTLDCLASLRTSQGVRWRLFIVDNASSDASVFFLGDLGADAELVRSAENGGWTGGNNLGVQRALAEGYDRIFLLNNDARVEPDTLACLLEAAASEKTPPILGPVHRREDAADRYDFIGADIHAETGMPVYQRGTDADLSALPSSFDVAFVSGAGLLLTRRHVEEIGPFDNKFYLNYDETDWCYRARRAGFPVRVVRRASIIHTSSGSIGGQWSALNVYFMTRNALLFAERHLSSRQRFHQLMDLFKHGRELTFANGAVLRIMLLAFGRASRLKAFRAGVRDYLLRRFGNCPDAIRRMR